ncbi:hypothetical protein [Streptomyces sp. x-80]|uniref:hypothetical protein n=1 Tax=Streptomyces sp. x-80 TaxID=2789282 RepID=UPI0039818C24
MPPAEIDFRLDGYDPATAHVEKHFWQSIEINRDTFTALAEHHTDGDRHSYYVIHDGSVTWGIPGEPPLVALHLHRDTQDRTFRFQHATLPLPSMAQSWLIARGCPPDAIGLRPGMTTAADDATRALEQRLMSDRGDHFALLHSHTDDTSANPQTTVLLRATDERTPLPFRILLEEADLGNGTHTLREGGFATAEAASEWWENWWAGEDTPALTAPPSGHRTTLPAAPARPIPATPPRGRGR